MLRVGLTGGVGTGKSEVARLLAERGAVVIDADELAHEVVAPGTPGLAEVVAEFGTDVLAADGSLDREATAARVFPDSTARIRLERIIHPRVRSRAAELEAHAPPGSVVVHDIPLLVETGPTDDFDLIVVVTAPFDVVVQRLREARGWTTEQVMQRVKAQASTEQRVAVADVVVDNSGGLDQLRPQVDALWDRLTSERGRT